MVDRESIERYRAATSQLSDLVEAELAAYFAALDLSRPEATRDALLEFMPLLVSQYGQVAETLALDWYDEMRGASGAAGRFQAAAPAAESITAERVESKVRYLAGHLWTPEPAAILSALTVATDKYVKQSGRDAIAYNAKREGVAWARVPTGAKTCAFCLVLASRDAIYHSKKAAGDQGRGVGDRFHGKCDCAVVRIGKASDYPADYLPDDYYDMYSSAAADDSPEVRAFLESLPANDKNKQLKAAVFSMRRNFPESVRDAVHPD